MCRFLLSAALCWALLPVSVVNAISSERSFSAPSQTSYPTVVRDIGDVDGDFVPDFAIADNDIGATYPSIRIHTSGALYSFSHSFNHTAGGYVVDFTAIDDMDGDGMADILVGDIRANNPSGSMTGAVCAYSSVTGASLGCAYGQVAGDYFGNQVALGPDVDGDGKREIIVAAPTDEFSFTGGGEVHVLSGANLSSLATLSNSLSTGKIYGASIAIIDDIDGDGKVDLAVSETPTLFQQGVSYGSVFVYSLGTVLQTTNHFSQFFRGTAGDQFGSHIISAGDLDSDGRGDVMVFYYDPSFTVRVEIYSAFTGSFIRSIDPKMPNPVVAARLTTDIDSDGLRDFVFGDPNHNGFTGQITVVGTSVGLIYRERGKQSQDALGGSLQPFNAVSSSSIPVILTTRDGATNIPGSVEALPEWSWGLGGTLGCGGASPSQQPTLLVNSLQLGSQATFTITNAPANSTAAIYAGPANSSWSPIALGSGCSTRLDLVAATPVTTITTDLTGSATFTLPVPSAQFYVGRSIVFQAIFAPNPGLVLTNSLDAAITQ